MEGEVDAFREGLKVLQAQVKETFPDSAVNSRWLASKSSSAARPKTSWKPRRSLAIVAEHAPISNRRRGVSGAPRQNVNVNLGLGACRAGAARTLSAAGHRRPQFQRRSRAWSRPP